jgi:hypothetical protein
MSQVHFHRVHTTLAELVNGLSDSNEVLMVSGPLATKEFFSVMFPKETHWRKGDGQMEDVYQEFATAFEVRDVIRPGLLKNGDRFWAWMEPAYRLEDVRRYHEEGFSRSPVIETREPEFPVGDGSRIAVVRRLEEKCNADFPSVYAMEAEEGMGAEGELRKLIKKRFGR